MSAHVTVTSLPYRSCVKSWIYDSRGAVGTCSVGTFLPTVLGACGGGQRRLSYLQELEEFVTHLIWVLESLARATLSHLF